MREKNQIKGGGGIKRREGKRQKDRGKARTGLDAELNKPSNFNALRFEYFPTTLVPPPPRAGMVMLPSRSNQCPRSHSQRGKKR